MGNTEPPAFNEDTFRLPTTPRTCLGQMKSLGNRWVIRTDKPWQRPDVIKTLVSVRGAGQQDFEGLLWGQRAHNPVHFPLGPRAHAEDRCCRGQAVKGRMAHTHSRGCPCPRLPKTSKERSVYRQRQPPERPQKRRRVEWDSYGNKE